MHTCISTHLAASLLIILAASLGCASDATKPEATKPTASTPPATTPAATAHADDHHRPNNLHWIKGGPGTATGASAGVLSGGVPEGADDFAHLCDLGIKTVISVDGATPDVELAKKYGLTYIHIPTTYSEVTTEEQVQVARAIKSSMDEGNVFIHCHHGKHRSPAQAAGAAVSLGWLTPDQAVAFMKNAGTAPTYEGLYACVAEAKPLDAAIINAPVAPGEFVPIRKPDGLVAAMIEIDLAYEHLGFIRAAKWQVPADQPDLVPVAEAGRLADHLRTSGEDPVSKAKGDAYMAALTKAVTDATALEEALARKDSTANLEKLWTPVAASCKDCHKQHRDKR